MISQLGYHRVLEYGLRVFMRDNKSTSGSKSLSLVATDKGKDGVKKGNEVKCELYGKTGHKKENCFSDV